MTRGNILFINCNYCQTEDCCRFDPTKSGCRKARLDLEKLDPDDVVTPMVIAAKNGHKELFQLFEDWKGGQLLTTEVKIAQLYFMMETEDNEDNPRFTDLLNSLLPTEEEKVSLYFFLKQ